MIDRDEDGFPTQAFCDGCGAYLYTPDPAPEDACRTCKPARAALAEARGEQPPASFYTAEQGWTPAGFAEQERRATNPDPLQTLLDRAVQCLMTTHYCLICSDCQRFRLEEKPRA